MSSPHSLPQMLQAKSLPLYNRYVYCKQIATSGFQQSTIIGHLTDHGPQHYANVESNLTLLLSDEIKDQLAPEEVFLLLCAVHFHDIGLLSKKEAGEDWQSTRREHVIRSFDYLDEYYADWGFNRFEAYVLKYICLGHGDDRLYQVPETQVIGRTQVRVRFLAALLRLADELDLDYTRVSRYIRQLRAIPADSLNHWLKHDAISGVWIDARSWTIAVYAMPEKPEHKAIIDELVGKKVQQELDYVRPILESHGLYYRRIDLVYTDSSAWPGAAFSSLKSPTILPDTQQQAIYLAFDILVDSVQSDGRCAVRVIESPAGQASAQIYPASELSSVGALQYGAVKTIGAQLFDALFKGHIKDRFRESIGRLQESERMRIRLRILSPDLQRLPWETLYDSERQEYLALSKRLSLVRYVHTPRPAPSVACPSPLKILVVISSPKDLPPLNVQQEEQKLRAAVRDLTQREELEIAVLPEVTVMAFREALQHDFHLVHFVGHGILDNNRGYLAFENETTHQAVPVDEETLGILLADTPTRFVFLNACESGTAIAENSLSGVAYKLVNAGVSTVVAMQFSITDASTITFASNFYKELAQRRPLDECVGRGREAVMLAAGLEAPDWVCPVLFTRAPDAHIFGA